MPKGWKKRFKNWTNNQRSNDACNFDGNRSLIKISRFWIVNFRKRLKKPFVFYHTTGITRLFEPRKWRDGITYLKQAPTWIYASRSILKNRIRLFYVIVVITIEP